MRGTLKPTPAELAYLDLRRRAMFKRMQDTGYCREGAVGQTKYRPDFTLIDDPLCPGNEGRVSVRWMYTTEGGWQIDDSLRD